MVHTGTIMPRPTITSVATKKTVPATMGTT